MTVESGQSHNCNYAMHVGILTQHVARSLDTLFPGEAAKKRRAERGTRVQSRIFASLLPALYYGGYNSCATLRNVHAICNAVVSPYPMARYRTHASLRMPNTELAIMRCWTELLLAFN